ncbi:nucleotide sugar dehydrogenase [Methanocaldococcus lauensis]|nr:nucleotide sugar dehydrogenase [Methanocaldococcus lauensis]
MNYKICVVGLGYVGLPLAMNFAKHFKVVGFDINEERIKELNNGFDRNYEFTKDDFEKIKNNIEFTTDEKKIKECDIVIVTVPTPITKDKKPDLRFLESASKIVGRNLKKGAIVVYESTTYPGCTEEFCLPILEKESGMKLGDFYIGYSPERINPGDKNHTINQITKIVAGCNEKVTKILCKIYGKITKVYPVSSIKVAESAKVIENIQRDINIALFNELAMLFDKLGIDSKEVFDAAATKWNFIRFYPGFVGGHCIPVDPYYLVAKALEVDYIPELITAGRRVNETIPKYVASKIVKLLIKYDKSIKNANICILGATYKENVPDLRSSKVKDLIEELKDYGIKNIVVVEPLINQERIFGVNNIKELKGKYDVIIYAVNHKDFENLDILSHLNNDGILIDIKRKFHKEEIENKGFIYWGL